MLTLRPLGSDEQPQSPRGIHLTAVLAAALEGNKPTQKHLYQHRERGGGWKRTVKDAPDVVSFFSIWGLFWPPLGTTCEILIGDGGFRVPLEAVYPRIPDPVGELFFLTPEDRSREVRLR